MRVEEIVKQRHLLTHPFYTRWQNGEVTIEQLREYAKQYYHYEKALPGFLTNAVENLPEGPARDAVAGVLNDELTHPKPHTDLWMQFAEGLGLDAQEVRDAEASSSTRNLVESYEDLSKRASDEALAALYAYESQVPEVADAKAEGLRTHYGVKDDSSLAFFELHSRLDVHHARALRTAFAENESSEKATGEALDAWWRMLDQFE